MQEIKEGEKVEIEKARKAQVALEEQREEAKNPEFQLKMTQEFKVIEEAEYIDTIINDRQQDIDKITSIMANIKDIATDFNMEVDLQGSKLEDLNGTMESVALNTKEATKELKEASEKSKKNGRCLIIIAVVIILFLILLFIILFATKAI